ncbi:MAG: DinB family protein [Terriglobales bacterium]
MAQVAEWQVARWYDRKFEFAFPVELYPDLCVRLRGTPARLEEMVRGCAAERMVREMPRAIVPKTASATAAAADGKWSAQEHVGHLLDLEPLWAARVEDFVGGGDKLSVADLSNRGTFEARYNERALPEVLAAFRRARLAMVDRLEEVETEFFGRTLTHPRLKTPMRLVDHLFFVAEHDDHHLAIIWEMVRG